ncbi:WAT1-related protein At4g30420-like isoform X1 [Macadamia integrifolia]|uniref:WAT1-related protein At4g30420-like isoform X1 n=1 Tax=Macadamia integrifolia TaxID=60698 RepID=UPI001C4F1975|nr:WAT1-related protein At4g30420-like isoform X1 [Macadamia integrifolia]
MTKNKKNINVFAKFSSSPYQAFKLQINLCKKEAMGCLEEYGPFMAMLTLQFTSAGIALSTQVALEHGMSTRVFVVYKLAIATLVIAPIAYFLGRKRENRTAIGAKVFCMIFRASLIGVTAFQNLYFEGIHLASSSVATAMINLVPATTFIVSASLGWERVDIRSGRSLAKVIGTFLCVSGAISMSLLKGPKLLTTKFPSESSSVSLFGNNNWLIGCLLIMGSICCWSFYIIFQVPMSKHYPDPVSLSAWMCFLGTLQSAILTFFLESDPTAWNLKSNIEFFCVLYTGIAGPALSYFVLSWCISKKGPLFSATFSPLCTVIVDVSACLFLHEKLYTGSLLGALAVVAGLFAVLWGKAKDVIDTEKEGKMINESWESCKIDLQEPFLTEKSHDVHGR